MYKLYIKKNECNVEIISIPSFFACYVNVFRFMLISLCIFFLLLLIIILLPACCKTINATEDEEQSKLE